MRDGCDTRVCLAGMSGVYGVENVHQLIAFLLSVTVWHHLDILRLCITTSRLYFSCLYIHSL